MWTRVASYSPASSFFCLPSPLSVRTRGEEGRGRSEGQAAAAAAAEEEEEEERAVPG